MNKTTKLLAVFLTAGLLLAGCGQKESTKSTSPSSTKATSRQQVNHPLKRRQKSHQLMKAKKKMH